MECGEEKDQRKSIPGREDLRVFFTRPTWHLGPWPQGFHSLLHSTFIEYLFYARSSGHSCEQEIVSALMCNF